MAGDSTEHLLARIDAALSRIEANGARAPDAALAAQHDTLCTAVGAALAQIDALIGVAPVAAPGAPRAKSAAS